MIKIIVNRTEIVIKYVKITIAEMKLTQEGIIFNVTLSLKVDLKFIFSEIPPLK